MKKIIPFKKDIIFKTNLDEVTSISLENTLKIDESILSGNFVVSGEYKITSESLDVEKFNYELPFSIAFDSKYNLKNATVDIDDFYYEIINNSILSINIEVLVDKIEEEEKMNKIEENINPINENVEERCIEEEIVESNIQNNSQEISLFDNINVVDTYSTYKVYIVRENDTIESILEKYNVTKENIEKYNDLSEIKIGNKIIIPVINEGN